MGYKLAIFDFDGTLADSFQWFCRAANQAALRYNLRPVDPADLEHFRGLDAVHIVQKLGVPAWKLPFIARYMRRHMAREVDGIQLFPGIDEALRLLAGGGLRLAVVTSNAKRNVQQVLGPELANLIEHYGCEASVFGKRPKLRAVLRRSRTAPEEAIYLGDELRDLHAAHAESIAFGAVTWGYTQPQVFAAHAPLQVFATPRDITDRLLLPTAPPSRRIWAR